ncbi:MAG: S-layer homology domain-containing protein [bacterium]
MRRVFVTAALLAVVGTAACAVEIADVGPGHWAYESIQMLVERGYLALYDDRTFQGDKPLSRVVFAAALGKLIDQIESGEIRMSGVDLKAIKKLSDEFKGDMANYDTRVAGIEKRISDIESGKVVIQQDISKATLEFRGSLTKLEEENANLRRDVNILTEELRSLSDDLKRSEQSRKRAQAALWIGVAVAAIIGIAAD